MKVKINQLKTHTDPRGIVFEPIEQESICTQQNCHIVISKPGIVRGNHYHLYGTETIAVAGPALLRFKDGAEAYEFEVHSDQVYKFVIPPKVSHAIKNTGKQDNILVAFNTVPHDPNKPDVIIDTLMD
jgi:UDP-2-acetamido-2,6-beta-L-arabino-hexul-4-ose reductase